MEDRLQFELKRKIGQKLIDEMFGSSDGTWELVRHSHGGQYRDQGIK